MSAEPFLLFQGTETAEAAETINTVKGLFAQAEINLIASIDDISHKGPPRLVPGHVEQFAFVPLAIREAGIAWRKRPVLVKRNGNGKVPGLRVEFSIPYTGDRRFWSCKPPHLGAAQRESGNILGYECGTSILCVIYEGSAGHPEHYRALFERDLGIINRNIEEIGHAVRSLNDSLKAAAENRVDAHRAIWSVPVADWLAAMKWPRAQDGS